MGWTSEMVATAYDVSREKQDQYALISHTRGEEVRLDAAVETVSTEFLNHAPVSPQGYMGRRNYSDRATRHRHLRGRHYSQRDHIRLAIQAEARLRMGRQPYYGRKRKWFGRRRRRLHPDHQKERRRVRDAHPRKIRDKYVRWYVCLLSTM